MKTLLRASQWASLGVCRKELLLAHTLPNGQCFNWDEVQNASPKMWTGVLGRRVIALRQKDEDVSFKCLNLQDKEDNKAVDAELKSLLVEYFQLDTKLEPLYEEWSKGDKRMKQVAACIPGMRIIRQDPLECLISFICSSNNNIKRITQMLTKLRTNYGELLMEQDGVEYFTFPSVKSLSLVEEQTLRDMGFGYRAKFIVKTVKTLQEKADGDDGEGEITPEQWLMKLRTGERDKVQEALMEFTGVGRKVADCVALFSLDQTACIPVDTHVWQIAIRDYDTDLKDCKSLTPAVYNRVGDLFRDRFGGAHAHAGWAHSVLFAGELPEFKHLLPAALQEEMDEFKKQEKLEKAEAKAAKSPSPRKVAKSPKAKSPRSATKNVKKEKRAKKEKAKSPRKEKSEKSKKRKGEGHIKEEDAEAAVALEVSVAAVVVPNKTEDDAGSEEGEIAEEGAPQPQAPSPRTPGGTRYKIPKKKETEEGHLT